ncbi:MAG: hypothetical protein K8R02_06355 [Anaerohalosphaeraceae bacterium]|nr:hypothetical protein [Anaerohalosphaeraceae bacterium]
MPVQITELTFLTYLAKRFKIPVPDYLTTEATGAQIRAALKRWGGKALAKPDILMGKRGKLGMVKNVSDGVDAQRILKSVQSTDINGIFPRTAYLVQHIPAEMEAYSAITYDSRFVGPAITVSLAGGMDVEDIAGEKKITLPIDIYKGLDAYKVDKILTKLECPQKAISQLSQSLVNLWDMFISTGMKMCEVNPWRITPEGKPVACDFKAVFDEPNFRYNNLDFSLPEYPVTSTFFEEEMSSWSTSSHQGQAHVSELDGKLVLPILFGGGASTIIVETLIRNGGEPLFLSDFGGNPTYERMYGTAKICFEHKLADANLILILGGKANNTLIDITFKAISDALRNYVDNHGPIKTPVVVGRGGPRLLNGLLILKDTLDSLHLPYVIFGPDTPVTKAAEYAAKFAKALKKMEHSNES